MAGVTEQDSPKPGGFLLPGRGEGGDATPTPLDPSSASRFTPDLLAWPQNQAEGGFSESEGVRGHWQASWEVEMFGFFIKFL